MNNFFTISVLLVGLLCIGSPVLSRTVTVTKNVNPYYGYNNYNNPAYCADLDRIEDYMFGRTYHRESTASRLNRIERRLFNKIYTSMNMADRMNNVLSNYRNNYDAYNRNYLSNFYDNSTPVSRIRNRLIGVPTGFSPQIYNAPFGSFGNNGINRSFTSNRGYGYRNDIPMTTGAGIHILP